MLPIVLYSITGLDWTGSDVFALFVLIESTFVLVCFQVSLLF